MRLWVPDYVLTGSIGGSQCSVTLSRAAGLTFVECIVALCFCDHDGVYNVGTLINIFGAGEFWRVALRNGTTHSMYRLL